MIDATAPGGQAGTSSKIENYLGFPTGISGADLASRAILQAQKFGAQFSNPSRVVHLEFENNVPMVCLDDGRTNLDSMRADRDRRRLSQAGRPGARTV